MEQSIEDGRGDHGIAEDFSPGSETLIAGTNNGSFLIAAREQFQSFLQAVFRTGLPRVSSKPTAVMKKVRSPCSQAFSPSATLDGSFRHLGARVKERFLHSRYNGRCKAP